MRSKLTVLALTVTLTLLAVVPGTAAPLAGPCAAGASYDPACDVNHDGVINVLDVQLAAGHWNQTGTWLSDASHNHLGQIWTGNPGNSYPLRIAGSFGEPGDNAPLVLSNSSPSGYGLRIDSSANHGVFVNSATAAGVRVENAGANGLYVVSAGNHGLDIGSAVVDGLRVSSAGGDGLEVVSAGFEGVQIGSAGTDGVYVGAAGTPSAFSNSDSSNGFEVAGAEGHGLYVGRADSSGVVVNSAGNYGMVVSSAGSAGVVVYSAGNAGVYVGSAGAQGVYVGSAGSHGVDVAGDSLAGYFRGNITVTGNCSGCLLATFGVNAGDTLLAPGDVVSLAGLRESGVDSVPMLLEVQLATGSAAVVGVVQGWAELITEKEPRPDEIGLRLVPRDGPADPGQYVTIAYSGLAQVKVSGPVAQGSKLAAGTKGAARALRTVTVDGVELAENGAVVGTALESLDAVDGLIWVLVNIQ
ncbi:MAG TPA: hypothetical protein VL334_19160 [Anaerolineae bacterium]|nr:hypothetical protein [Anaerolineae bacterium]